MRSIAVNVQSLDDLHSGKMLFPQHQKELNASGHVNGVIESVGIMEQGTGDKKTCVALLISTKFIDPDAREDGEQTMWIVASIPASAYLQASMTVSMAVRRFEKPNVENKS